MSAIDHYINAIIQRGEVAAKEDGSAAIEAHHLLLGIADHEDTTPGAILVAAGLDRESIRGALDREFEHSLSTVGVSPSAYSLPRPALDPDRHLGMGASARLALERGFAHAARKKDLRPAHLLLGVLEAEIGTVPRALQLAGVDREELMGRVKETAANTAW
ncbi:Clp protease N-terminal domain-containing protein [Nonomuraea insulae]|uniref:Clp protease N-terminal domain-containing protein n=1 Tax=Nonomuraea insulae TaxID=1616787 RepID=A0ABW1CM91_9ACTN